MDDVESKFPATCKEVDTSPFTFPIYEYCHPSYYPADYDPWLVDQDVCGDRSIVGAAVIGGFVYRGAKYKDILNGNFIWADHLMK